MCCDNWNEDGGAESVKAGRLEMDCSFEAIFASQWMIGLVSTWMDRSDGLSGRSDRKAGGGLVRTLAFARCTSRGSNWAYDGISAIEKDRAKLRRRGMRRCARGRIGVGGAE